MSDAGYAPESPIPTINLPRDTRDAATSSINLPPEHLGGWKFSPPPGLDSNFHAASSLLAARYRGMLMKFKSSRVSLSSRISIFENHRSFVERSTRFASLRFFIRFQTIGSHGKIGAQLSVCRMKRWREDTRLVCVANARVSCCLGLFVSFFPPRFDMKRKRPGII